MTDADSTSTWVTAMVAVLQRLAAPADDQQEYLRELGVEDSIDELGLEFDDCFRPLAPQLADQDALAALDALTAVDAALGDENLPWTEDGLRKATQWETVRRLAREAEHVLGSDAAN